MPTNEEDDRKAHKKNFTNAADEAAKKGANRVPTPTPLFKSAEPKKAPLTPGQLHDKAAKEAVRKAKYSAQNPGQPGYPATPGTLQNTGRRDDKKKPKKF